MVDTKKYLMGGTKVIFTAEPDYCKEAQEDSGKIATVIKDRGNCVDIFIPNSKNNIDYRNYTWHVPKDTIKLLKDVQLLFDFMR